MLAAVSMCIQFRSYLRGAKFTIHTYHKSHRFKDTDGMMARWLHTLQQFQFSIIHRAGRDHGNADGLSRVPISPCSQCTRVDCPPVDIAVEVVWINRLNPLVTRRTLILSGEDWVAQLDDDLSRPASQDTFNSRILLA